jgi:hypothetical protein
MAIASQDYVPPVSYAHRAKPYAAEAQFVLEPDHVAINQGSRSGNFPYRDIVMIRLIYKPRNTTNEGYQAKLYRRDKKTAALTNLSWKSLVDLERQDVPYSQFVEALISRTAAANPAIVLRAGMARWLHVVTALAGLSAIVALVIVTAQAILNGGYPVALLTGALTLYFGWWSLRYLGRNRPRGFRADSIPADVMPPQPSSDNAIS